MKKIRIPPGGGFRNGRVLSKKEVTMAVLKYARRHGFYARTVRAVTVLYRSALDEWMDNAEVK